MYGQTGMRERKRNERDKTRAKKRNCWKTATDREREFREGEKEIEKLEKANMKKKKVFLPTHLTLLTKNRILFF